MEVEIDGVKYARQSEEHEEAACRKCAGWRDGNLCTKLPCMDEDNDAEYGYFVIKEVKE